MIPLHAKQHQYSFWTVMGTVHKIKHQDSVIFIMAAGV